MITLSHLETNVTTACQNACVSCNHFIPIQRGGYVSPEQVKRDLTAFAKVAHTPRYALIGGEPLLHKKLLEIADIARASGIADELEVWTNGIKLAAQGDEFWQAFDRVVLTVYPNHPLDMDAIKRAADKNKTELEVKDGPRYFTRLLDRDMAHELQAARRYQACWYRTFTHVLDNGYFYRCCTSPYIPKLLLGLPEGTDGLAVKGITEEKLRAFLSESGPMKSCYRCAGHNAEHINWREERKNWLEESAKP